jgi:hypothetical protein
MAKQKLSERVDFTYFIGMSMSLVLFNISLFIHKDSGLPMMFALVSLCTYIGVLIRGMLDRDSWGKTIIKRKLSAIIGFTSMFVIFAIESVLLLTGSFELLPEQINGLLIYGGVGLLILFLFLYVFWFRKLTFDVPGNS